jgi:beta-galactosidase/beta-glucuronidase
LPWRVTARGSQPTAPGRDSSGSQSAAESSYRFFLRGPWQSIPLARVERSENGTLVWSGIDLPAAATIRLPASWQDVFGNFRGRVRFRRCFHPPTNVEADDRLFIVFDAIGGDGLVRLNGSFLGKTAAHGSRTNLEVTGRLRANNELEIDVEYAGFDAAPQVGGLFAPVALEIRSPRSPVNPD